MLLCQMSHGQILDTTVLSCHVPFSMLQTVDSCQQNLLGEALQAVEQAPLASILRAKPKAKSMAHTGMDWDTTPRCV